jgi:APA family basic amino acid/polyamine antiporter
MQTVSPGRLARVLGLSDLVYIVLGTVIGSGIFLVPGPVLRQSGGRVRVALAVWVGGGVLAFLGALTYAELGAMQPEAGGIYIYIRDAFGRLPAFLFGWTMFFVIASGSIATLAVAATLYLGQLLPLSPAGARVVALAVIAALALLNIRGTRQSARVQDWATAVKIGAIVLMSVALLALSGRALGHTSGAAAALTGAPAVAVLPRPGAAGVGVAMVAALWAYEGWPYVTFSAGETRDPQRTLPLGIAIGVAILVAIYLLANLAYVAALGAPAVAQSDHVASDAMRVVLGPTASRALTVIVLISVCSAANAIILTAPRVFYAMAGDGLFFRPLAQVHPRFGTPALAIAATALWAMLLAATGTFEQLLTYVVFTAWIFYGLGALSVFVFRRTRPDVPRPFRVPGYPWTPVLFVAAAFGIVVSTLVGQPARAAVGLVVVLAGLPAYLIWRKGARGAR